MWGFWIQPSCPRPRVPWAAQKALGFCKEKTRWKLEKNQQESSKRYQNSSKTGTTKVVKKSENMWENYQNKKCLKFASGLQVTVIPNCFYCRVFFQYTGDAIVCIKVLKAPMFYMNHSRHYPFCVLQVTSPKVWDVQHPDIPQWTKGHEDLRMSNNIWLQYRIVPNRHIGTDSESSSRDDVKMDIVFVYAYYIHVYIHHIHVSYIA